MTKKALVPWVLPNDPAAPYEAATKKYVDDGEYTADWKQSVRVASTANVTGTYTPGLGGGTPTPGALTGMTNTLDGITLVTGDRLLLKNQTNAASNGIWYVTTVGTGANGVWDRPPDFGGGLINGYAAQTSAPGPVVAVEQGTINADTLWLMTNDRPIQIDGGGSPTLQTWAQIGAKLVTDLTINKGSNTGNALIGRVWLGEDDSSYSGPAVAGSALTAYSDGSWRLWSVDGAGVGALGLGGSATVVTSWLTHQILTGLDNYSGFGGGLTARIRPDGTVFGTNFGAYNYLDNGNFSVWQRGTGAITPGAAGVGVYAADRWIVRSAGAALSGLGASDIASARPDTSSSQYALFATGNTGVTTVSFIQRMEVEPLSRLFSRTGQSVTVSFVVYNTTGAAFTPQIVLSTPTALENFTTTTAVSTNNVQSVPTGVPTTVWVTIPAATLAAYSQIANGLQVELLIPSGSMNTTGKSVSVYAAKIEIGSIPTPIIPETMAVEMIRCQRHFYRINSQGTQHFLSNFAQTTATAGYGIMTFPIRMRAAPVCAVSAQNHASTFVAAATTVGSVFAGACTPETARVQVSAGGTQGQAGYMMLNTSLAWIQFSAEL